MQNQAIVEMATDMTIFSKMLATFLERILPASKKANLFELNEIKVCSHKS